MLALELQTSSSDCRIVERLAGTCAALNQDSHPSLCVRGEKRAAWIDHNQNSSILNGWSLTSRACRPVLFTRRPDVTSP